MMHSYVLWHPSSGSSLLQLYQRAFCCPSPVAPPPSSLPKCTRLLCAQVPLIFIWCRDASFEIMNQNLDLSLRPKCQTVLGFFSLLLYTCNCKMHDYAAQGQSRHCSGTSSASVADSKVKYSPVHVLSCKMPAAGLMFECPCNNHCVQTC